MNSNYEQTIIEKLIHFGESNEAIRAVLLTSSLCNLDASADILSDFDVELYFEDPAPFVENDGWIETLGMGPVMALWHWPNEWDYEKGDDRSWMRMLYYQDGTKMDITLAYLADLRKLSATDTLPDHYNIGYKVLLDKDGVTGSLKPPTYTAFILDPPSRPQYMSRVETFWMESTYAAKFLWRDDIIAAKWILHQLADRGVREVLEWCAGMERGWTWRPGKLGRGLGKTLAPDLYRQMIESYAAGDTDDLWESLFKTTALYRKAAITVGEKLGYDYPHDLDKRVTIYHQTLRALDKQIASREELARLLEQSFDSSFP